jgi:uncharacterized membrane-anchored protein YhcB (DUF1043 family)
MIWIVALGCFLAGAAAGALLFKIFRSDEAQVRDLKQQLQRLSEEHENYKSSVHSHFGNTARLFGQLTDSYREVYQHMAEGARQLCPDYISNQLTLNSDTKTLLKDDRQAPGEVKVQPLDYAARSDAQSTGTLSDEYGLERH